MSILHPLSSSSSSSSSSFIPQENPLIHSTELTNGKNANKWAAAIKDTHVKRALEVLKSNLEVRLKEKRTPGAMDSVAYTLKNIKILQGSAENLYSILFKKKWTEDDLVKMSCFIRSIRIAEATDLINPTSEFDIKYTLESFTLIEHLQHLIVLKLNAACNPENNCFFMLPIPKDLNQETPLTLVFGFNGEKWGIHEQFETDSTSPYVATWASKLRPDLSYAVVLNGQAVMTDPLVAFTFQASERPELQAVIASKNASQLLFTIRALYCPGGVPHSGSAGNAIEFLGLFGPGTQNKLMASSENVETSIAFRAAKAGIELFKNQWIDQFFENPSDQIVEVVCYPKGTTEEKLLDVLQMAVEEYEAAVLESNTQLIETNTLLIEYIVEDYDAEFTPEELGLPGSSPVIEQVPDQLDASSSSGSSSGSSSSPSQIDSQKTIEVPAIVLAKTLLTRREKKNLKQKQIKETASSSSSSSSSLSSSSSKKPLEKAALAELLTPKLAADAEMILKGGRLRNKRKQTAFFKKVIELKMNENDRTDSSRRRSSHISLVLEQGSKTTNAVTYVDKHSRDRNRGHSASTQKKTLLALLTPM